MELFDGGVLSSCQVTGCTPRRPANPSRCLCECRRAPQSLRSEFLLALRSYDLVPIASTAYYLQVQLLFNLYDQLDDIISDLMTFIPMSFIPTHNSPKVSEFPHIRVPIP